MKLKELYKKEQVDILNQLVDILDINNHPTFILYELDNDTQKQQQIIDLIPNIRKYFSLSNVRGIKIQKHLQNRNDRTICVVLKRLKRFNISQ